MRQASPNAHLFGCSTGGTHSRHTVRDKTLALTAIAFDHNHVATARAPIEGVDRSFVAGEELVRQLDPRGLRHVFVLSEGLQVNGSDLVSGINTAPRIQGCADQAFRSRDSAWRSLARLELVSGAQIGATSVDDHLNLASRPAHRWSTGL